MTSPFHAGERAVQHRAGVTSERHERAERFIQPEMSDRHRHFVESVGLLFTALVDAAGRPWATPIFGAPGIALAPSPRNLVLARAPDLADTLGLDTAPDAPIGVLGIDLSKRQRIRVNGRFATHGPEGLVIGVHQAFGNCPQYIQPRVLQIRASGRTLRAERTKLESAVVRRIVERADTFFIASRAPDIQDGGAGIDVSHRGGPPGFLRMNADASLFFPDFRGNRFFNTLGNIEADGRVGLFVPDFVTCAAALVTGRAKIDWTSNRIDASDGAERIVDVTCDEVWHVAEALPAAARLIRASTVIERT